MPRHVDAQETIWSQIIVFSSVLIEPGGLRSAEYVFGDYFGVSRHVNAQQTTLTEIIVRSSVLNVSGDFSTRCVCFWKLLRCASTRSCLGDNIVLNHSLLLGFD